MSGVEVQAAKYCRRPARWAQSARRAAAVPLSVHRCDHQVHEPPRPRSSVDVRPSGRLPSSRSACRTQLRIAPAEGSNFWASSSGVRPARTSSTMRCRNSVEYGGRVLGIVDTFLLLRGYVSTKAGQLHDFILSWCGHCDRTSSLIAQALCDCRASDRAPGAYQIADIGEPVGRGHTVDERPRRSDQAAARARR